MRNEYKEAYPVQQHVDAVNAALADQAGKLVLMHWNDSDEAIGSYYGIDGRNPKAYFEGWHIAVGILTDEPIREKLDGPFWLWQLPTVRPVHELVIWPEIWRWDKMRKFYAPNLGGTYPSLEESEDLGAEDWGANPKPARRSQVVIGVDAIRTWLAGNRHAKSDHAKIFAQILNQTGYREAA